MRFSVWPNASHGWENILAVSRHAADSGWDGVWVADHFMPNADDISGPVLECWTTLAGLAATVLVSDGESTWFEGFQLIALYAVIGIVFFAA